MSVAQTDVRSYLGGHNGCCGPHKFGCQFLKCDMFTPKNAADFCKMKEKVREHVRATCHVESMQDGHLMGSFHIGHEAQFPEWDIFASVNWWNARQIDSLVISETIYCTIICSLRVSWD